MRSPSSIRDDDKDYDGTREDVVLASNTLSLAALGSFFVSGYPVVAWLAGLFVLASLVASTLSAKRDREFEASPSPKAPSGLIQYCERLPDSGVPDRQSTS